MFGKFEQHRKRRPCTAFFSQTPLPAVPVSVTPTRLRHRCHMCSACCVFILCLCHRAAAALGAMWVMCLQGLCRQHSRADLLIALADGHFIFFRVWLCFFPQMALERVLPCHMAYVGLWRLSMGEELPNRILNPDGCCQITHQKGCPPPTPSTVCLASLPTPLLITRIIQL